MDTQPESTKGNLKGLAPTLLAEFTSDFLNQNATFLQSGL
jgi:hypothetical protein